MATMQDMEQARFSGSSGDRPTYRDSWVTPTVMDAAGFCGKPDKGRTSPNSGRTLTGQALEAEGKGPHWATPSARDWKDTPGMAQTGVNPDGSERKRTDQLARQVFAQTEGKMSLNPDWVEWLMGWPVGWTSLEPLASAEIRSWATDPANNGEVPRTSHKTPNRTPRLKAIGNGQVPACAAMAFNILSRKFK